MKDGAIETGLVKRLAEVAAAYGADPARWPAPERIRLEEAARARPDLLAEAGEVDRVLALAAEPRISHGGEARLLAAIAQQAKPTGGNIVAMPVRRSTGPRSMSGWSWAAAATLAASLACGIYLGSLDSTGFIFDPDAVANDDPVDLAGLGDVSDYLEEGS
jgi:hypothetical protein